MRVHIPLSFLSFLALCGCDAAQQAHLCNVSSVFLYVQPQGANLATPLQPCECLGFGEFPLTDDPPRDFNIHVQHPDGDSYDFSVSLPDESNSGEIYILVEWPEPLEPGIIQLSEPECPTGITLCNQSNINVHIFPHGVGTSPATLLMPGECRSMEVPEDSQNVGFSVTDEDRGFLGGCGLALASEGDQVIWDGGSLNCIDN